MVLGPHQTKNHEIFELSQAYENRYQFIKARIEEGMKNKHETLVQQLKEIDKRLHEIANISKTIEKDIQMEFEGGIIKRLID